MYDFFISEYNFLIVERLKPELNTLNETVAKLEKN